MTKRKKQSGQNKPKPPKAFKNLSVIAYSQSLDMQNIENHLKAVEALNAANTLFFLPQMTDLPERIESKKIDSWNPLEWQKSTQGQGNNPLLLLDLDSLESDQICVFFEKLKVHFKATGRCVFSEENNPNAKGGMALIPIVDLEEITTDISTASPLVSLKQYYRVFYPNAILRADKISGSITPVKSNRSSRFSGFINWFIKIPISKIKRGGAFSDSNSPGYRLLFLFTTVISFFLITHLSQNAAVSGDEYRYIDQASKVYDYYASFGKDKSAVSQTGIDPQHYNAQSFDNILFVLQKWLRLESDAFGFRHFWNSVVGWSAMLFASFIALKIGGYRMALITFILLFLSPRFLGHSYNNHRDIPMAAAVCFSVMVMIPYLKYLPKIKWKYFILVALGIAWAYSLRLGGGVLLIGYILAFTGIAFLIKAGSISGVFKNLSITIPMFGYTLFASITGFALGVLTWPYALESPIANSFEVFKASAELGVSLRQLFEGEQIWSNSMPWYYTGKWMLITIPVLVLASFTFSFFSLKRIINKRNLLAWLLVLTAVVLPIFYALVFVNTHYGGWRHFIFVYPFIAILSAMGLEGLFRIFGNKKIKNILWLLIFVGMIHPISFVIKNHPFEYMYFNEWIGGTKGAHGYYETDYSLNSLKESSEWLIENVLKNHEAETPLIIATNDRRASLYYLRDYLDVATVRYTRYYNKSSMNWDYATFYCAYISPYQIQNGFWPPNNTIFDVLVDRVPVGAVIKRPSDLDFKGFQALENGLREQAIEYFNQYLEINSENEEVWSALANTYLQTGIHEKALIAAKESLNLMPENIGALQVSIVVYLNQNNLTEAARFSQKLISAQSNSFIGYYYMALTLNRQEMYSDAISYGQNAIRYNPNSRIGYEVLLESLNAIGDSHQANHIRQLMEQNTR